MMHYHNNILFLFLCDQSVCILHQYTVTLSVYILSVYYVIGTCMHTYRADKYLREAEEDVTLVILHSQRTNI